MRCEPAFVRERARNLRGSRAARWGRRAARAMASRASAFGTHTSSDVQSLHAARGCAPAPCARGAHGIFFSWLLRTAGEGDIDLGFSGATEAHSRPRKKRKRRPHCISHVVFAPGHSPQRKTTDRFGTATGLSVARS